MKKLYLILWNLFLLQSPIISHSNTIKDSTRASLRILEIEAQLTFDDVPLSNYSVYISCNGVLTDSIYVRHTHPVYFHFEANDIYTIIFRKKGFLDKMVMVDTYMKKKLTKNQEEYTFDFDLELDPLASHVKSGYEDFPAGWVHFDSKRKDFEMSKNYYQQTHDD